MSDADDDHTAGSQEIEFDENPSDPNQIPEDNFLNAPLGAHELRDPSSDNLANAPNEAPPGNPDTYSGPAGPEQDGSSSEPSSDPVETPSSDDQTDNADVAGGDDGGD
jgi:hypothetical protein